MDEKLALNGFEILVFDELPSTNSFLYDKVAGNADTADMVVAARRQTAGKGMGKNRWESEPNKNLLFSIALNVNFLKAEEQFKISQSVSVSILNTLNSFLPLHLATSTSIKWPNDIYIGSKKLAGILIQNTISGMMMRKTIIGIGLNVNQINFDGGIPNPVSLKMATGNDFDLDILLNELIINIKDNIDELKTESGKGKIDGMYRKKLFRLGEWAEYEHEGDVKIMIINGYDKYGRLCLSDKNGHEIVCDIKEIKFIL